MINDTWELQVRGRVSETQHIHTLHFRELGGDFLGTDLITAWQTAALASYRAIFSSYHTPLLTIAAAKVCGSLPLPGPDEVPIVGAAQNGTRATTTQEIMPAYVACVVIEKGSLAGRSRSGRFFIGGTFEGDSLGNVFAPGFLALVQAYADALKAAFVTPSVPNWRLVTHSRLLARDCPECDPPRSALPCTGSATPVQSLIVSPYTTTMRSRKLGRGL